jgi:hypothetical protein
LVSQRGVTAKGKGKTPLDVTVVGSFWETTLVVEAGLTGGYCQALGLS